MKLLFLSFFVIASRLLLAQGGNPNPEIMSGPINRLEGGVIDGIVANDEQIMRAKIEYEHVRAADYVWSKRVFSRIDCREKMNVDLFFPLDSFSSDWKTPTSRSNLDTSTWNKSQTRYSLWTIISRHIMNGDLTVYRPNPKDYKQAFDGYSFKYPIKKANRDDFFTSTAYSSEVLDNFIAVRGPNKNYPFMDAATPAQEHDLQKTSLSFQDWMDSLQQVPDYQDIRLNEKVIQTYWNNASVGGYLEEPGMVVYISSESIIAYYIKEDWFFDKERSMLDKRIIGIAPVAYFQQDPNAVSKGELTSIVMIENGAFITIDSKSNKKVPFGAPDQVVERELFWLYFPELRNVMARYIVYNDQNDAQWMSMDDLFWKRKFNATIYRVSDKFDREIQDYKFGVDALYEAERIKEEIRTWEHDVWNF
jgi:hypothetical protein